MRRTGKGFTLFEALISMAILSVFVFIGSTSLSNLAPKYSLERAVWEVRSTLNALRFRALYEGRSYRVRLASAACSVEAYDETEKRWVLSARTIFDRVRIESNNIPVFTPQGTVTGLATITISNEWGGYKLTLAITGRIKTARIR
jgi:prepilin-type N-terminal cleavage/methylation domain-containing protein